MFDRIKKITLLLSLSSCFLQADTLAQTSDAAEKQAQASGKEAEARMDKEKADKESEAKQAQEDLAKKPKNNNPP